MKKSILFLILSTLIIGCNNDSNAKKTVENESQDVNALIKSENSSEIFKLATTYASNGGKENLTKAYELYNKAAELGSTDAMLQLGLLLREGNEVVSRNDKASTQWFMKLAEKGEAAGLHNVGVAYYKGLGVELDKKKAYHYFLQSAEKCLLQSQVLVSGLLYNGDGVNKDLAASFQWMLKAAEQGDIDSQNNVGLAYENGEGVEKDPKQSFIWFKKAADNGQVFANYNVALKYFTGNGVNQNLDEAIKYAEVAFKKGDEGAYELLSEIYGDETSLKYNPAKAANLKKEYENLKN